MQLSGIYPAARGTCAKTIYQSLAALSHLDPIAYVFRPRGTLPPPLIYDIAKQQKSSGHLQLRLVQNLYARTIANPLQDDQLDEATT